MGVRPGFTWLRQRPNLLYNAMMHPIIPYACRGLVWYQGEANADKPELYKDSLPLWIQSLRKAWEKEDLHFMVVMLPGYGPEDGPPDQKSWAPFREVQMSALDLDHTSVVNTIDLGDAKNIHPPDKTPICERLSLLARQDVYSEKVMAQGPVYREHSIERNTMIIHLDHAEGLKTIDGKGPSGFWLAADDQQWHRASAKIEGTNIILHSDMVSKPIACRYGFTGKPTVNLINEADLPAYPFRTDSWGLK
jgi:sialate O-acetylesterase